MKRVVQLTFWFETVLSFLVNFFCEELIFRRMGFGGEYRIHLYRDDESLSLVMILHARSELDAKSEAGRMLKDGLVRAEIWRDEVRIGAVDLRTAPLSATDHSMPNQGRQRY